jgi:hypothetical protein
MLTDVQGPETCNTYNMLKLGALLYHASADSGDAHAMRYVDFSERALYNHILASQHPETGGFVYFTPMRPNHYRVYSEVHAGMWCCVGSGLESQAKYGEFIYARDLVRASDSEAQAIPAVHLNLFIASQLQWPDQGIALRQETRFPDEPRTTIRIERDGHFVLKLRQPSWLAAAPQLRINGEALAVTTKPGEYLALERHWRKGDRITMTLPMRARLEALPGNGDYHALLYGPIVLAARTQPFDGETLDYFADDTRMGHVPNGAMCPLDATPALRDIDPASVEKLAPLAGSPLHFDASALFHAQRPGSLELIPFFRLHESRYSLYWPYRSGDGRTPDPIARADGEHLALQRQTIDSVAPGEQQPEAEHGYRGEQSETGRYRDRHWRHSRAWFGYQLSDPQNEARSLQLSYAGIDRDRTFSIYLDDALIAKVRLDGDAREFYTVDYPLPETLPPAIDGKRELRFVAEPGSLAGGIYGVRLLRTAHAEHRID